MPAVGSHTPGATTEGGLCISYLGLTSSGRQLCPVGQMQSHCQHHVFCCFAQFRLSWLVASQAALVSSAWD